MAIRIFRKLYRRRTIFKFIFSGGSAASVGIIILYTLTSLLGVWYLLSAILSFIVAFFVSFFLQKFWTFRDSTKEKMYGQMTWYFVVGLINLGINTAGMYVFVDIFGIWYIFSQILISGILALSNFTIYKYLIFKRVGGKEGGIPNEAPKKKILIATGIYPPDYRGPATLLESLPGALKSKGFEIKIITYSDVPASELEKEWVFRINKKRPPVVRHLLYFFRLWELSNWADLVYATDVYSVGYLTFFCCRLREKKYILRFTGDSAWESARLKAQIADSIVDFEENTYSPAIEKQKEKRKRIMVSAEKIIVDCESGGRLAELIGVPKEKIKVIYNSLDTKKFIASEEKVRSIRKSCGQDSKIIISPGQLNPWKGFDGVIKIIPRLIEGLGSGLHLLILGEGPEKTSLENLAKELKIANNVHFLGKVVHSEMINYLSAADLFILNSDYEGMSHAILEAMYAARPIIVSRSGGNCELIGNGREGLTFGYNNLDELFNAAYKMLNDRPKAKQLAKNAKIKSDNFKWENVVNGTVKVFEELV